MHIFLDVLVKRYMHPCFKTLKKSSSRDPFLQQIDMMCGELQHPTHKHTTPCLVVSCLKNFPGIVSVGEATVHIVFFFF